MAVFKIFQKERKERRQHLHSGSKTTTLGSIRQPEVSAEGTVTSHFRMATWGHWQFLKTSGIPGADLV